MFTTLAIALPVCKQYSGVDLTDTTWDISLTAFLESSKAVEGYRPIIVAAMQILKFSSGITRGSLSSADGVKWIDPTQIKDAIAGYLMEQEGLDSSLTGIPYQWSVYFLRPKLCGCDPVALGPTGMSAMVV